MRILVLYCEVMPYNVVSYKSLLKLNENVEIDVISWGVDKKLTPYKPEILDRVNYFDEKDFNFEMLKELYILNKYKLVYVCNRREKKFLRLASFARNNNTVVIGQSDEQLYNSPRQYIKKFFARYLYRRHFDYMCVPGYFQYEFMKFLNFKSNQILLGAYTANITLFDEFYFNNSNLTLRPIIELLFIGRLEEEKGLIPFLSVLENLKSTYNFKFVIVGNGSLKDQIQKFDFVEYHSFLNQESILNLLKNVSFFILPSVYEPWGVVIHEMAAAGIPTICSDACGARSAFVFDCYNGFIFKSNSPDSIESALIKAFSLSLDKINLFKLRSNQLSKSITPDLWGETINSFIS